jgi:hypothetical protein
MIKSVSAALIVLSAGAVAAEETRQLDAHEHGVGQLDIAFDGKRIAMELHAPGADIVGFEYAAESNEDRAKVDDAVARLARPLDLFLLPASAGCGVIEASASLEAEEDHEEHEEHKEEGHDHADHEGEDHADHGDEEHAAHEDEDHEGHEDAHDHDDHDDHADEAGHTEFHAEYMLECADPAQATLITFAYFDAFPNALELEVQVISERGATAFEVMRDAPSLDLRELF